MILRFEQDTKLYILSTQRHEADVPRSAQFLWHGNQRCGTDSCQGCKNKAPMYVWWTNDPQKAAKVAQYASDPGLKKYLLSLKSQQDEARAASRAVDADIEIPVPKGLELYPFQRAGVKYALQFKRCLIGDEPRLGKTLQAIGLVNCREEIKKVLVVSPATVKINWMREANKWLIRDFAVRIADSKHLPRSSDLEFLIINYDILHRYVEELKARNFDLVVIDEAHLMNNPTSRRSKMCTVLGKQSEWLLMLTGTPDTNGRPIRMLPLLRLLPAVMKRIGTEYRYKFRYCGGKRTNTGFGGKTFYDFNGASNLQELNDLLRESGMIRRLRKDVFKEMPPKIRQIIEIEPTGHTRAVVRQALEAWSGREDEIADLESDIELAKADNNEEAYKRAVARLRDTMKVAFTDMSRVRHAEAVEMVPYAIKHLEESIEGSGKIFAFAYHVEGVLEALAAHFGDRCVLVTGKTSMVKRQEAIDRFRTEPGLEFFFGQMIAAGVGISLAAASHVVGIETDWVPGNVDQVEDRVVDITKKESILVQHLVFQDSLGCKMTKRTVAKQETIHATLDKQRGDTEPESETPDEPQRRTRTKDRKAELEDAALTQDQIDTIHAGLRFLSARCDGAQGLDGAGFNKLDTRIGKSLAGVSRLSQGQAKLGLRIISKYKRQLEGVRL